MITKSVFTFGGVIILAALLISACGGAETPTAEPEVPITGPATATTAPATATEPPATDVPTSTTVPSTATLEASNELVGAYRVKLPAAAPGISAGYYRVIFGDDGNYKIDYSPLEAQDGIVGVYGTYTADGNQVTFTDVEGFAACPAEEGVSGTYEWSLSSQGLTQAPIEDGCEGRVYVLSTMSFTRDR